MAKKKDTNVNSLLQEALKEVTQRHYGNVYSARQLNEHFRVLPVDTYALRWLLDANGIILSKVYLFEGDPSAGKSQFGYDIGARFVDHGGVFILVETENKTSQATLEAKMGVERMNTDRVWYHQTFSVDAASDASAEEKAGAWQAAVSSWVEKFKSTDGLKEVPVFILVDSMTGVSGHETREEYKKDGMLSGRSYAEGATANSIARFFRNISAELASTNVTLGFTNHVKVDINAAASQSYGPTPKRAVGGEQPKFHSACTLRFARGSSKALATRLRREVKIATFKQSFGLDSRKLTVPFYAYIDDDGRRVVYWDWDEATCMLLHTYCRVPSQGGSSEARKILPIEYKQGLYSVPKLGIDPCRPPEFCAQLEERQEVLEQLRKIILLSYNVYREYDGQSNA